MSENDALSTDSSDGVLVGHAPPARLVRPDEAKPLIAHLDGYMAHDGITTIVGWVFDPGNQVSGFVRLAEDVTPSSEAYAVYALDDDGDRIHIHRVARSDVAQAMGVDNDPASRYGFVLTIKGGLGDSSLALALRDGRYMILPAQNPSGRIDGQQSSQQYQRGFRAFIGSLPTLIEDPSRIFAAIERVYPLGDAGLLVFGWMFFPAGSPVAISVHSVDRAERLSKNDMFPLVREDVVKSFGVRFPGAPKRSGFVCRVPLPTGTGEPRALRLDFGNLGEVWLNLPTDRALIPGVEQIKEILGLIPSPGEMRHELYRLFENGLGDAIEAVSSARPVLGCEVSVREFGRQVLSPHISIVVPLYGRFDFLRHQMAQFVDDPDFEQAELIYVVDDPEILSKSLELAANCNALFGLPFKVLWSGRNLGYAGANNLGVSVARGEFLILLNSDVIPQKLGWLSTLSAAFGDLPDAGAVAPLLLYGDGSIQHAGMAPKEDPTLPGFLLNVHPGKGLIWDGGDRPVEHCLLTGACLMLRKADFLSVGGFDEGYVIGDFEDSDLCLALRKRGRRLFLIPTARLWHLERQSQGLERISGSRQLLTLFNGWRYRRRIRLGQIAEPSALR